MTSGGAPAGTPARIRPGRGWYVLAALLPVLGLVAGLAGAFLLVRDVPSRLQRVVVPGQAEIVLDEAGAHTIFHEYRSTVDGRVFVADPQPSGLVVRVEAPSGDALQLSPPSGNFEYNLGGRSGIAVLTFDAPSPGRYLLAAGYPEGAVEPQVVLAVGGRLGGTLARSVGVGIGVPLASFLLGVLIAVVTFIKRRRAKEAATA